MAGKLVGTEGQRDGKVELLNKTTDTKIAGKQNGGHNMADTIQPGQKWQENRLTSLDWKNIKQQGERHRTYYTHTHTQKHFETENH